MAKKKFKRYFVSASVRPNEVENTLNKWRKLHFMIFDWQVINYTSVDQRIDKVWVYAEVMDKR